MKIDGLLDTNVLIAMLVEAHEHHEPSFELLMSESDRRFAVTAHSYAEAYNALTRRGEHAPFRLSPEEAWAALQAIRAVTLLIGLTASQTFDAIGHYAQARGIGSRLYDRLIGEAAVVYGISAIITWNIGHMRSLFPNLSVVTPRELVQSV